MKRTSGLIRVLAALILIGCSQVPPAAGPEMSTPVATSTDAPATATVRATATPTVAPEETQTPAAAASSQAERDVVARVQADLARRLSIDTEQVALVEVTPVEWPDAGLGCPLSEHDYENVSTSGYRIVLETQGETYEYHTDAGRRYVLCNDGQPVLPTFPVTPGAIDDGEPWMPVDPPD